MAAPDGRGGIGLAEQSSTAQPDSATAPFSVLIASGSVWHQPTVYAKSGDWFAWLDLILALFLLLSAMLQ